MNTGEVTYPTSKKRYEAEDAFLTGRAGMFFVSSNLSHFIDGLTAVADCEDCISKRSVHRGEQIISDT